MSKIQRTKVKAAYQVAYASDEAPRDHHFVQADGQTLMDTEYEVSDVRHIADGRHVAKRLEEIIGVSSGSLTSLVDFSEYNVQYIEEAETIMSCLLYTSDAADE